MDGFNELCGNRPVNFYNVNLLLNPFQPFIDVAFFIMPWLDMIIGIIAAAIASSGFWAFLMNRRENKSAINKLLMGLAHDRILHLAAKHIERGYITPDEYENLHNYLYTPYAANGGNGAAKRAMAEVDKLEIRTINQLTNGGNKQ